MKRRTREKDELKAPAAVTAAYLAVTLFLYLLFPGFGGYRQITEAKWVFYTVLTLSYLVVTAVCRLASAAEGEKRICGFKEVWGGLGSAGLLAVGYLLFTFLSALLSPYRETAFFGSGRREGFVTVLLYVLSFLAVSRYGRPKEWLLWLFAAAVSLCCALALFQFTGANPLRLYPAGMNYYDGNVLYSGEFLGTVGNADILSALLSLAIPAFAAAAAKMKARRRFLLLIPVAMSFAVLIIASTAGGLLGAAAAIVISVPVLIENKKGKRTACIIIAAVIVLGLAAVFFLGGKTGGFLYEVSEVMHGRADDTFGSGRVYIWKSVAPLAARRPIFGGGPDTLGLFTDAAFERYDANLGITIHNAIDAAHNEYLNILVNQGAVSLAFYLGLLAVAAVKWVKTAAKSPAAAICGCGALGYCLQALFGVSSPITAPYLWLALALLIAADKNQGPQIRDIAA